ncbi:MAG: endonuclease/exonuclease/phosphatase family protein, partial [Chloroflexi bacterium]|nr:endonuclease/exonuclease/phosphatase family protein [Chloroflexota bacterium]
MLPPMRHVAAGPTDPIRFATFNASLTRDRAGRALSDLSAPGDAQASAVAEIIQRTRPEVLLINEFDYEPDNALADAFAANYLGVSQHADVDPIEYRYVYVAPSNTGVPSGHDLNRDGTVGGPHDAFGFGEFPGQYGMAVFSQHPIEYGRIRTFRHFLWKDMPGALLPVLPATGQPWFSDAALDVVRLSSKSHWDLPIRIGSTTVHFLVSHPTPPAFDGPERVKARRNHDEIRLWADYLTPGASGFLCDDAGIRGGLAPGEPFVVAGDQNSDPLDGNGLPGSIQQLLEHPLVDATVAPASEGAAQAAKRQGGVNDRHAGDPRHDTASFAARGPGNLRVDYVL